MSATMSESSPESHTESTEPLHWVGRALAALATAAYRKPLIASLLIVLATALLGTGATRLRINPDLSELLPRSFDSVQNLDALRTEFGGIGHLTIVCDGENPEALRAFADALAKSIESLETVRYVDHKRPVDFFSDRALYYLDLADVEVIRDRFAARELYERLHANPLYVDFDEDGPPVLDFTDIRAKYEEFGDPDAEPPEAYFIGSGGKRLVLFVKPTQLASDLDFAKQLIADVQEQITATGPATFDPKMTVELSGRYKKRTDMQAVVQRDLRTASLLALALMLGYLGLHFRRATSVVLVFVPLIIGLTWTYGLAGWTLGTLNILTAFVGTILLGVGIDVGIHVLDRAEHERSRGGVEAVRAAFGRTGQAAAIASLTTVAGFASLALSDFRVFREFGILSSSGLLLVLVSYLVCLPVLLRLRDQVQRKDVSAKAAHFPPAGFIVKFSPWGFWLCAVGIFGALTWVSSARFNYDFGSLETRDLRSYQLDTEVNELLGHSQTPLVLMTKTTAAAKLAAGELRERSKKRGEASGIDRVTTSAEIVPANQAAKAIILKSLSETLLLIDPETLEEDERVQLIDLERRVKMAPFTEADLPDSVRRSFHAVDGSGDFVLILPGISLTDGAKIRGLADELRDLPVTEGASPETRSATGEAMVLADVLDSVFQETPRSIVIAFSAIFLALWILLGRLRSAFLCMLPAVVTVACTIGLMPLFGLEFNYLNIIVLPVLLGMGVDGGAHILGRITDQGDVEKGLRLAGHSVVGALITTALGFVALLGASHPGLASIAKLALLGLGINIVATVVFLPAVIALWGKASVHAKTTSGWIAQAVTVGRAGCAPVGPGSLGAVVALPIAWLMQDQAAWVWAIVLVVSSLASIWVVELYVKTQPSKDPQEVVLDETIGCLITLAFVPWEFFWVLGGYVAFRFFDMAKPGPIGVLDRKAPGGYGVMLDDIAAGLIAGPLLYLLGLYV
tara:strand:+ start:44868 stop:47774 length:2907 start_codon:yes stop_codon:yes gene_type:complete